MIFVWNLTTYAAIALAPNAHEESLDWHAAIKRPEWVAVAIALVTLLIFIWQTIITRNLAKNALKETNHMVASDRAWLVIASLNTNGSVPWFGAPPLYWWTIKNVGNTPAILFESQAVCTVANGAGLPQAPHYPAPVILNERMLAPNDTLELNTFWSLEDGRLFRDGLETIITPILFAYGFVKYKTVFSETIHEARFCDAWICNDDPTRMHRPPVITFAPWLEAPTEYTKHS
jgi:hypothetical protein